MPPRSQKRASGESGAVEEARRDGEEITSELTVDIPDETSRKWRTPGFMRMRFSWAEDDRMVMERAKVVANQRIRDAFPDVFWILSSIYDIVREPKRDEAGEIVRDLYGFPEWQQRADGTYIEDFNKLNNRDLAHYIHLISTRLFTWEQVSAEMWGDAMFAKAQYEERFAISYDAPMTGTVDDRTAVGKKDAADERYFAIFMSTLSRQAEALCRSMDRLSMRLKDVLVSS